MTAAPDPTEVRALWVDVAVTRKGEGLIVNRSEEMAQYVDDGELHYCDTFDDRCSPEHPATPGLYRWEGFDFLGWDEGDPVYAKGGQWTPLALASATEAPPVAGMGELLGYRSMPSGGRADFKQLREAVAEACRGERVDDGLPENLYPGHHMVEGINYNSLDRIVTAFVDAALTKPTPPASVSGEVVTVPRALLETLMRNRVGELPGRGWLRDNDEVRATVNALADLLAAAPEAATPSAVGGVDRMREVVERFIADYDDGDRADAGNGPLMEAHVADFLAALATGETSPDRGSSQP